jgi:hypothetical protein
MALQSEGQISFSNIAGELGSSTPYSLRAMSSEAGFSTPDTMNEFYGYDAGGGVILTPFFTTGVSDVDPYDRCFLTASENAWHNGTSSTPDIGDTVYSDSSGNDPLKAGFYGVDDIKFDTTKFTIEIAPGGGVINLYQC